MSKTNEPQILSTPATVIKDDDDPTPADPTLPSIPVSYPIKTLDELASRSYFSSFHYPFNKSSVPLTKVDMEKRPRILVCHDFKGGYQDDKWVQGGDNESAYAIWHWHLIDVFAYFSHYLVTLPPPGWTNTAHRHGVKVLGTLSPPYGDADFNNKFLASMDGVRTYADRMAELSSALGFDGWLLNMEINNLNQAQVANLEEFVSHLTQSMHSLVPGSLVIWYDSVDKDGQLIYQNQLNEKNKPFFDICDGLFANYFWREEYPQKSADFAGDRQFDVYMGIDVFGRGTYGGGGWDTNVALDVIKKANVSAAIFAPGWVYERNSIDDFQANQNRWWGLVEKSFGIVNFYPFTLPFYSNFDQGHGFHISIEGVNVSNASWNNLSSQGLQPFLEYNEDSTPVEVLVDFNGESYNGGGNITFKGTLQDDSFSQARLFLGELDFSETLNLTYSVKLEGNSDIGLLLVFSDNTTNKTTSVLVASSGANHLASKFDELLVAHQVNNTEQASAWIIWESGIEPRSGLKLREIHAVCFIKKLENGEQRAISNSSSEVYAVLGHIALKTPSENTVFPPSSLWDVEAQHVDISQNSKTLSVQIIWKLKDGNSAQFYQYNIYIEKLDGIQEYVGVANVGTYYVSGLSIPSGTSTVKFLIQACGVDGSFQKLDESPYLELNVAN